MSDFPDDIMATASWVAAHRLDLSKEAGQQIVRLIAHSLNDERNKTAARIAALEAENRDLRSGAYLVSVVEERDRLRTAAQAYVDSVNGEPEKDCWGTEDGKEAPGAERFASDWAWRAYDAKKQTAFDALIAALEDKT